MSPALVDTLLVCFIVAVVLWVFILQPRARRMRRAAHLAALAAVLPDGRIADGRVHASFGGCSLQAWPFKATYSQSSMRSSHPVPGDTFTIQLRGLQGGAYWRCDTQLQLRHPFGRPRLELTDELPAAANWLAKLAGAQFAQNPEQVERLRAAGLMQPLEDLQALSAHLRLEFVPSIEGLAEQRMQRPPGFAGLSPELADTLRPSGQLECIVQAKGGLGPSPQTFQQELDILERIIRINQQANPAPEPQHIVAAPSASRRSVHQSVIGSWSNEIITLSFEPDGQLAVSSPRSRRGAQRGTWSVAADGRLQLSGGPRLQATAWIDGHELTVMLQGMAWTLHRG